jgi:RNA polymerase sigma factor (sigma-70 family)
VSDHYEVLVKGNKLAKFHARRIMGRRKLGRFLTVLQQPARAAALKVSASQVEAIRAIPEEDRVAILATREAVDDLCRQYEKLAKKLARQLAQITGRDNDADLAQLESEATVGLLKAIRGYSRLDVKFVTYAYRTIRNEVSRYLQRNSNMLTGVNSPLVVKYKKRQEALSKEGLPHNFDDVCVELKLSAKQTKRLKDSLHEVASESDLEESLAKLLLDGKPKTSVDSELINRIEGVSMTTLERDSWISQNDEIRSLFPDAFVSLKEVAEHHAVTPQAASEALKRARKKLAAALGDWSR